MNTHKHLIRSALTIVFGLMLLICGCNGSPGISDIPGILQNESKDWRASLEETRDILVREKREALATEINEFLREAEGDAGEELRANSDFFRQRIFLELFGGDDASHLAKVTPRIIDRHKSVTEQPEITLYGWDLHQPDVRIFHYIFGENPVDVSQAVAINGPYSGTVDLTKVNLTPDSEHLEIRIAKQGSYFINIIQPPRYKVELTGYIWGLDDEYGKDPQRRIEIGDYVDGRHVKTEILDALQIRDRQKLYSGELKVGGEVRIEVDIFVKQMDAKNALTVDGECRLYEGTSTSSSDLDDKEKFNFDVSLDGGGREKEVKLLNTETAGGDKGTVYMKVSFSAEKRKTTPRSSAVTLAGKLGDLQQKQR
ncbi:hypothetical protein ACFLU6_00755 [Acidobacteriota bacterium]